MLFNKRIIKNIANFCCTDRKEVKSALYWDFTFDIGKSQSYYLLALSYQNTTLFNKTTKLCSIMLSLVLLCHKKDEKAVKLLCDTLLDASPRLATGIKILGTDGENSILNQTCNAFPCAMLLVCVKHVEKNIKRILPKTMSDNKRTNILRKIFGAHLCKGLVDCETLQDFDNNVSIFYEELSMDEELKEFPRYFKKQKENTIKYHLIKGTVNACELNDDQDKFYNNSIESMNKLLKHWENYKKIDLYAFAKEYEELIKAYQGLRGPYEVRDEFKNNMRNFNTEYASLSAPKKAKVKNCY